MNKIKFTFCVHALIALCLSGVAAAVAQEATAQQQQQQSESGRDSDARMRPVEAATPASDVPEAPATAPADGLLEMPQPAPLANQVVDGDIVFTSPGAFTYPRDIRLSDNFGGLRFYGADQLTTTPAGAAIQFFGNNASPYNGQLYLDSGAHNSAALIFRTAQAGGTITERMRITASGRVGIGTTITSASTTLRVVNVGSATDAVEGQSTAAGGIGVDGVTAAFQGTGVRGFASGLSSVGVRGVAAGEAGIAGRFEGNVQVTGTLSKGGGAFKIDHPLDPTNKYLSHSFVESPDMMNIYNGIVTLDACGRATVTMPEWFEALNREFRYQLTAVGAPGPNLYVAEKIKGNRFQIAGGRAGMEVSWQVTGVRRDAYAEKHRIKIEEEKPAAERGTYLHPEAFGQPREKGVERALYPEESQRPTPKPQPEGEASKETTAAKRTTTDQQ